MRAALGEGAGQLAVNLQIQTAAHQLQPLDVAPRLEVLLNAPVHHHIRVEFIEVQLMGIHRLLEAQAQALHLRVFTGIHLDQQQFEHRLVGRLNPFEQLPQPGPHEFAGRDVCQMPQVDGFVSPNKTLGEQGVGKFGVVGLFIRRHPPPHRRTPREPNGGAIKLIQQ